jgi:predicted ABC-type ATPase
VETTLSGKNYLQMMRHARGIDLGFEVVLIYIGTESVEINPRVNSFRA